MRTCDVQSEVAIAERRFHHVERMLAERTEEAVGASQRIDQLQQECCEAQKAVLYLRDQGLINNDKATGIVRAEESAAAESVKMVRALKNEYQEAQQHI